MAKRFSRRALLGWSVSALGASVALGQAAPEQALIRVGDRIRVTVLRSADYTGTFQVVTDGTLSGPGFGTLRAEGRTLAALREDIRVRLLDFLKNPEVFLHFETQLPELVYVVGIVTRGTAEGLADTVQLPSGAVTLREGVDVRTLLAGAVFGQDADLFEATLFRDGEPYREIDLPGVLGDDPSAWVGPLAANDTLLVRRRPTIRVWLVGQFARPGERYVPEETTLEQLVTLAGGPLVGSGTNPLESQALLDKTRIEVRRGESVTEFPARPSADAAEFVLEAGDTVTLVLPKAVRVVVSGEVVREAEYTVDTDKDLMALISTAGGATPLGTLRGVLVFRRGEVFRFDLTMAARGEAPPDFPLEDSDLVVVPRNQEYLYVLGDVNAPGRFPIPDGEVLRASDAISLVGGVNTRGTLRRMVLMRAGADGKYIPTVFNLDEFVRGGDLSANPMLQSGDVLYVSQAQTPSVSLVNQIGAIISSAILLDSLLGR